MKLAHISPSCNMRESAKLLRAKGMLPDYIFVARAEIGLYTTLHRLKARVPMSAIVRRYLPKRTW